MLKPPSDSLLSAQMYPGRRIMKVVNRTPVKARNKDQNPQKESPVVMDSDDDSPQTPMLQRRHSGKERLATPNAVQSKFSRSRPGGEVCHGKCISRHREHARRGA
jgi:hypothetical protein